MDPLSVDVIAANITMYREVAESYDQCWGSVLGDNLDPALEKDLNLIASMQIPKGVRPHCLDCGSGTGAITAKMLARGWLVTAVDVSPEMLAVLEQKVTHWRREVTLVNRSIEEFLAEPGPQYHLIAFNSVLHHIYDYSGVLSLALDRLAPGGFLYTNVDPVLPRWPTLTGIFDSLDIAAAKLFHDRSDLLPGIGRRIRKLLTSSNPTYGRKIVTAGDVAEFHARSGVDDGKILKLAKIKGLEIIEHSRYPLARTIVASRINRFFKLREEFKIIARRTHLPAAVD